jgi:hypothetical protein
VPADLGRASRHRSALVSMFVTHYSPRSTS